MPRHRISASLRIDAPATRLYAILADYTQGHPRILLKPVYARELDKLAAVASSLSS
jgi:hypothetical protein